VTSSRVFAAASPFTNGLGGSTGDSFLISASVLMRLVSTGDGSASVSSLVSTGSVLILSSTLICCSRAAATACGRTESATGSFVLNELFWLLLLLSELRRRCECEDELDDEEGI